MSHITINDLVIIPKLERKIFKKEKYQLLKKKTTTCVLLPLAFIFLTSCTSEPKKQHERREIIQNQRKRKYNDDELEVKKQTKKTLDQKKITKADSLTKSNLIYIVNPIQIPIGISINKKQPKSSSGQRKGKIIYTSKSKKQNRWKQY